MRHDGYYIYRGTYRAPRWILYIEGRIARRDECMDRYVPHVSRTERQRVTSPDLRDTLYSPIFPRLLVEVTIPDLRDTLYSPIFPRGFLWRFVR
uniref:Uncharacterized protein n=1 Tax=Solanum tuberosum TaxID=4113 RepID=M1DDM0_SOLTU